MTTVLTYKDYQGSVTFEDGRLVIRVLHIDDSVSDECDSAAQVQAVFEDLVEDYLETCTAVGKEPAKPFKGSFNVRISPALHKKAVFAATKAGETLNNWVAGAIDQRLQRESQPTIWDEEIIGALYQQHQSREAQSRRMYAATEVTMISRTAAPAFFDDLTFTRTSNRKPWHAYNG